MNTFTLGFDMAPLKKTFFFLFCYFLFSFSIILSITGIFIYNFEKISFYEYDILLKQRMSLAGQNNDIIIVGDSSGLNGLLANNIYNSTGLKTVNLSLYANNGTQSYEILLKNYIENNKMPKKVILYFSVISPNNWKAITYEKSILILRYANSSQKLKFIFQNPYSLILIINRSVRASIRYLIFQEKQKVYASKVLEELDKSSGFMESKTDNKEIKCEPIKPEFSLEKVKSEIKKIKENFQNLNIKIYMAPTNECIYKKNIYTKLYEGIIDNNLYFLEDGYFNDFSHLNLKGAIKNSAIFSDWLLKK